MFITKVFFNDKCNVINATGNLLTSQDPYFDKDGHERKLPEGATQQQRRVWKKIRAKSFSHDRCLFGPRTPCCLDCGVGLAPLATIIPVIGPLFMYVVHGRVVSVADELRIPAKLQAKLSANIGFDFLLTIIPLLGIFLGYLNQCSTRNAALIYDFICNQIEKNTGGEDGVVRYDDRYVDGEWEDLETGPYDPMEMELVGGGHKSKNKKKKKWQRQEAGAVGEMQTGVL